MPRFTFCVPNLNKMPYLPACIDSILAQDDSDWRCVFVDGYSTDGSWEYMQQFATDSRFLLLRGLRQGMYADWNECLRHVETEYFYFLTSDDTCLPSLVSTTIAALDTYPNVDVCHFQFNLINETGTTVIDHETLIHKAFGLYADINQTAHLRSGVCEFMMHFVYRALYQTITSLVFRRRVIDALGGFATNYSAIADYDWTMRLGLYTDILYIPELLATWRVYADQATEDCMLPHITERLLAIAQKNLDLLESSNFVTALKQPINRKQILADLYDEHACSLYRSNIWQHRFRLIKNYPLYPVKKLINRISKNQLYPYSGRNNFARQLIEVYGLPWAPMLVIDNIYPPAKERGLYGSAAVLVGASQCAPTDHSPISTFHC